MTPRWKRVWEPIDKKLSPDEQYPRFIKNKDSYVIDDVFRKEETKNGSRMLARSVDAGKYHFLLINFLIPNSNKNAGALARYTIKNNRLELYYFNISAVKIWASEHQISDKDLQLQGVADHEGSLRAAVLDEKMMGILSSLPDSEKYWELQAVFKKVK